MTGVAQSVGHCPAKQKVVRLIPGQAHAWVVGQVPDWGRMRGSRGMCLSLRPFSSF